MGGISALIGGLSDDSEKASQSQWQAATNAMNFQSEMYQQTRKDQAPWREVGGRSIRAAEREINRGPGAFKQSPYYNFLLKEGNKELARSQSARGILDSGAALREAERYGKGLASTEYQNFLTNWLQTRVNPLLVASGQGQVATNATSGAALQTANMISDNMNRAGDATASGYINSANQRTGMINAFTQDANNAMFYNYMNQPSASYTPSYSGAGYMGLGYGGMGGGSFGGSPGY